jgi:hypothetical protein
MSEPKLQAPGAGIPFHQRLALKYIVRPFVAKRSDWDKNQALFYDMNNKLLELTSTLSGDQHTTQILIPPLTGLEDSSRNWSITMVLEHLAIVGEGISEIIVSLGHGHIPEQLISTANVKPSVDSSYKDAMKRYSAFIETAEDKTAPAKAAYEKDPNIRKLTKHHPWFGAMNLKEWQWLQGIHLQIHYNQAQLIKKRL